MANGLGHLGRALVEQGRTDAAIPLLREGIHLAERLGNTWYVLTCVETFAAAAAHQRQWRRAARLYGAVDSICRTGEVVIAPFDQVLNEGYARRIQLAMGDDGYRRARDEGRAMSLNSAIAEALGLDPVPAR